MDIRRDKMLKTTLPLAVLLLLTNTNFAFSKKTDPNVLDKNYTEVTILDKGVKRIIHVPKESNLTSKINAYEAKKVAQKKGVIVSFYTTEELSISEFETAYGLKFKEKLQIGYYIFDNVSDKSDTQIISEIITNETNVKTVKPNWEKKNQPR